MESKCFVKKYSDGTHVIVVGQGSGCDSLVEVIKERLDEVVMKNDCGKCEVAPDSLVGFYKCKFKELVASGAGRWQFERLLEEMECSIKSMAKDVSDLSRCYDGLKNSLEFVCMGR